MQEMEIKHQGGQLGLKYVFVEEAGQVGFDALFTVAEAWLHTEEVEVSRLKKVGHNCEGFLCHGKELDMSQLNEREHENTHRRSILCVWDYC